MLYRDFDALVEVSLQEFLEQDDPPIPRHRIHVVRIKEGEAIRPVYVKHGHCPKCGRKLQDEEQICNICGHFIEL